DRPAAQYHGVIARQYAATALDERVVSHRRWLHQAARLEQVDPLVKVRQSRQAPQVTRVDGHVLGEPAIHAEAHFLKPLALIRIAVRAGPAIRAPEHLFRTHRLSDFIGAARALVERLAPRLDHHAPPLLAH